MSALSLIALVRIFSVTSGLRLERGRDAVVQEVDRLARAPQQARQVLAAPPANAMIGMRGGFWDWQASLPDVAPEWQPVLGEALRRSAATAGPVRAEQPLGQSVLVVAARPAGPHLMAWAAFLVQPSIYLRPWQIIITLLSIATTLLVTTTLSAAFSFRRSATDLHRCLLSLAEDLSTPIPRPRIRELGEVADGIARLAQGLAQSREAEQRLAGELAQKERLAALGRVAAGVAHEVRNPLASIKLRLDLAAASTRMPPAAEQAITHASAEIARLDRLVADLLVVAGQKRGARSETSLGALVRARAEALQPWAATRQVAVTVTGDAAATVDAESVARAVDNLLRNAVEASPPGQAVAARVLAQGGALVVRVEDRGPGVGGHDAELFEPFFTTKPGGTGLGLALSRAIARAHGGDVVYTRDGDVTRFDLALGSCAGARDREAA